MVEIVPLPVLLASASEASGEKIAKRCVACHTFDKGGPNRTGPNLWGVVKAPVAGVDGFAYSAALKAVGAEGRVWDFEKLDAYILNPKGYIRGQLDEFRRAEKTGTARRSDQVSPVKGGQSGTLA